MIILPVCRALVNLFGPVLAYETSVEYWSQLCPYCGASMIRDGGFVRKTPRGLGPFRIQQVRCANKKDCPRPAPTRESLLPNWLLPYQRQTAARQETVIAAVDDRLWTVEQAAEHVDVDPKTVSRWCARFATTVQVFDAAICRLLATARELAYWVVDGSLRGCSAGRQFLQQLGLLRRLRCVWFPDCCLAFLCWLWPRAFLPSRQTIRSRFAPEYAP